MPDARAIDLFSLSPALWVHGMVLIAFFAASTSLLRNALMLEALFSRAVQIAVCALTLLPAVAIAAVLVFAAWQHPERAWRNLAVAAVAYAAWFLAARAARVVRPDVDADDARWIGIGACITFPVGVFAAVVFA